MAQFVYTMNRVGKVVPPKREILKDISLSFFPGAKIGVLGLNGAGKSTLLRIMAGVDTEYNGEARAQPGINVGYLPQEPELDNSKNVREVVEEALSEVKDAQAQLDLVTALCFCYCGDVLSLGQKGMDGAFLFFVIIFHQRFYQCLSAKTSG